jgi:phage shock protein A
MQAITIHQLQQNPHSYVLAAQQGEQVLLLDGDKVVAQLLPYRQSASQGPEPVPEPSAEPSAEPTAVPSPEPAPSPERAPAPPAERFAQYFNAKDVAAALEGLAQIEATIIMAKKDHESLWQRARDWENRAIVLMKQAQTGEKTLDEVNAVVMEVLTEQGKATQLADQKLREISELEYLKAQLQEQADRLRELKATYHRRIVEMPDSSETLSMLERMKAKIAKNEVLSGLYQAEAARREADEALERKVNDILGTEKQKEQEALDALKAKMGLK